MYDASEFVYSEELQAAISDAVSALARMENDYQQRRAAVERRSLSKGQKAFLHAQLDAKQRRDRELLVLHVANLHYRMVRATMLGSLAKPVPAVSAFRAFPL